MNSFVVIFVPCGETGRDIMAAFRKEVDSAELAEKPANVASEKIDDAEQLPLWRWFVSSK